MLAKYQQKQTLRHMFSLSDWFNQQMECGKYKNVRYISQAKIHHHHHHHYH